MAGGEKQQLSFGTMLKVEQDRNRKHGYFWAPNSQFGGENSDFGDPIKLEWGRYGRYRLPNDCPVRKLLKIATSNTSTLGQKTHTKPIKNPNLLWKKIVSTIHFQLHHAFLAFHHFHQISPPAILGAFRSGRSRFASLLKAIHVGEFRSWSRYWIEINAGTPW